MRKAFLKKISKYYYNNTQVACPTDDFSKALNDEIRMIEDSPTKLLKTQDQSIKKNRQDKLRNELVEKLVTKVPLKLKRVPVKLPDSENYRTAEDRKTNRFNCEVDLTMQTKASKKESEHSKHVSRCFSAINLTIQECESPR